MDKPLLFSIALMNLTLSGSFVDSYGDTPVCEAAATESLIPSVYR